MYLTYLPTSYIYQVPLSSDGNLLVSNELSAKDLKFCAKQFYSIKFSFECV